MTTSGREPSYRPASQGTVLRTAMLGTLHGTVLEIGPGRGANLGHYPADVRWIGVEPNARHRARLRREVGRLARPARLLAGRAESLDLPDGSVDAVVGSYLLCSVEDPVAALAEIRRVLRPGGRYVFAEHVAAPAGTWARRGQNAWSALVGVRRSACRPNRETGTAIERAGFDTVDLHRFAPAPPGARVRRIAGEAR